MGRFFEGEMGPLKKLRFLFSFWSAWPSALKEGAHLRMAAYRRFLGLCLLIFHFSILLFFLVFVMKQLSDMTKNLFKMGGSNSRLRRGGVCYRINMSNTLQLVLDRGVRHLFMFFYYKLAQKSTCMQLCWIKVRPSPSETVGFVYCNGRRLKLKGNFSFTLKALFVIKI